MANTYKLTYFDRKGTAEPARMIFSLAGQKFEDERITVEEWAARKPSTPGGILPYLQMSQGTLYEAGTIIMYLGGKLGLMPSCHFARAQSASILVKLNDFYNYATEHVYKPAVLKVVPMPEDFDQKRAKAKQMLADLASLIQSIVKPDSKFIHGNEITAIDAVLFITCEPLPAMFPEAKNDIPWLNKFMANMKADPKVQEYLNNRK